MRLADVLALTGATKKTLYRWMERHPTIATPDPNSKLGHSFPRPYGNQGRAVLWDEAAVSQWWNDNSTTVGRHPENAEVTEIAWDAFRTAMLMQPNCYHDQESGEDVVEDDMALVMRFERRGDDAILTFKNVSDAVYFKLKYA